LYSMDSANSWNLPSSQFLHTAVALVEYNPAPHVLHAAVLWVLLSWYCPSTQVVQDSALFLKAVPATQNLQVKVYSVASANSWNLPSSQFLHTAVALVEYNPALHDLQAAVAWVLLSWYCPSTQSIQAVVFVSNFFPATQNLHAYSLASFNS